MSNSDIKENSLSILKAITSNEEVKIHFQDSLDDNFFSFNKSSIKGGDYNLPLAGCLTDNRPLLDLSCAFTLFHDFDKRSYYSSQQQEFVDDFEKIRVSHLIEEEFFGCAQNIYKKIECDVDYLDTEINSKTLSVILLDSLINKQKFPVIRQKSAVISNILGKIEPKLLKLIKDLSHDLQNQEEFAKKTIKIQDLWEKSLENERKEQEKKENSEIEEGLSEKDRRNIQNIEKNSGDDEVNDQNTHENEVTTEENEENTIKSEEGEAKSDKKDQETQSFSENSNKTNEYQIEFKNPYQIYTSKYDEVINPQKITDQEDLEMLRLELDSKLEDLDKISRKLTTKLKQKLLSKKFQNPNPNDLEGLLNRKKLTSIITSPSPRNIYLENIKNNLNDTVVTILLDNSGSMRGRPIIMACLACEILAKILENFQIKCEIIGFTTADWKGGRAKKDWEISGKPENPGRLNELRHIIYKSFNQSFKKSKVNLGLMLKEGVLKENIDGEAVLFAKSRLINREERRKILMVISDGNPIDDSTNLSNEEDILSDHLKQVVSNIQKQKQIEILAIGVGHDTDDYYQNSITIRKIEELGDAMIQKISGLL